MGTRILLGVLWLLHWLPLSVQAALGRGLGALLFALAGSRRRIAMRNLELCFPEKPLPTQAADDAALQAACAAAINREMERLIAECPQQYLWGYHRYKRPRRSKAEVSA